MEAEVRELYWEEWERDPNNYLLHARGLVP
jgi:hypothetical protein